jgi:energy-converting hydrogenase Eha subunit H
MMSSWLVVALQLGILVCGCAMCIANSRNSKSALALSFGFGLQAVIWSLPMYITLVPDPGEAAIRMYQYVPWGWLMAAAQAVLTVGVIGLIREVRTTRVRGSDR